MHIQTSGASAPVPPSPLAAEYLRLHQIRRQLEAELHRMVEILDAIDAETEDREGVEIYLAGAWKVVDEDREDDDPAGGDICDELHDADGGAL